jgi:hypothetical protein
MFRNAILALAALTGVLSPAALADGITTTREVIQDRRAKPKRTCQRTGAVDIRLAAVGVRRTPILQLPRFETQVNPLSGFEIQPEAWLDPTEERADFEPVDWWTDATPALRLRAQSGDVLFHAFFPPGPKSVAALNQPDQLSQIEKIRPRGRAAIVNHVWLLVSGQAYRMHIDAGATTEQLTEFALTSGTTVGYCTSRIRWEKDGTVRHLKAKY